MDINPETLTALKKKASASIKRILYIDLKPELPDFDDKVEELVQRLLQDGPSTLESEQALFNDFFKTFYKISNETSLKEYLSSNNLMMRGKPNKPQVELDASYVVIENNPAPIQPAIVETIGELPAQKHIPAAREVIKEEDIPVNNALLKETFEI